MGMLLNQVITTAAAGAVGSVYQTRSGPGSAQLPSGLICQANFTYGSGGTTVDAWLQTSLDGGTNWCDVAHFTQFATASSRLVCNVQSSVALAIGAATDGTLAAGSINNGLFGPLWRIKYTSVGTYAGNTTLRIDVFTDGLVLSPISGG